MTDISRSRYLSTLQAVKWGTTLTTVRNQGPFETKTRLIGCYRGLHVCKGCKCQARHMDLPDFSQSSTELGC